MLPRDVAAGGDQGHRGEKRAPRRKGDAASRAELESASKQPLSERRRTSTDTAKHLPSCGCAMGRNCGLCSLALSGAFARSGDGHVQQELVSPRLPPGHVHPFCLALPSNL